ncbi:MAG: hypothetical protein NVS4B11_26710 [Ktedonobacteraceae bacterium]
MFNNISWYCTAISLKRLTMVLSIVMLLGLLVSACDSPPAHTTTVVPSIGFPTTAPPLRTPPFGSAGNVAPTVKVLSSVAPTLIVQFPLFPISIKQLFPKATGLVTVMQGDPASSVFDNVTVDVQNMPPNVKFTVFFVEIALKPFGHAEYVGDVITHSDGSGESTFHLITFVAFAADARKSLVTSKDQSGDASGIQLEHVGMWFDGVIAARQVLNNPNLPGTPFDGGFPALHGGPQVMSDSQQLPVI